jgi:outer membrane protein
MKMLFSLIAHVMILSISLSALAAPPQVTVSIITDGPMKRDITLFDILEKEITDLMGSEFHVVMPIEQHRNGGWKLEGIRQALNEALADPDVDVVFTMGLLASHVAARVPNLKKPVIAFMVSDIELQEFPFKEGASGKQNFVYMSSLSQSGGQIQTFHDLVGFHHLAILVDELWIEAIPGVSTVIDGFRKKLNIEITLVHVTDSVKDILTALPDKADAVYITPLMRLSLENIKELAEGLIERKLPSFSHLGRKEIELGILATNSGRSDDIIKYARRIAVNLHRTLLGKDAGSLPVTFETGERLAINMRTARTIGFSPQWVYLRDADVLFDDELEGALPISLTGAMQEAVKANLDLRAVELSVQVAEDEVRLARSPWLPQLDIGAASTRIDDDRATPAGQAERSTDAEVVGSQLIYSEKNRADFQISKYLKSSISHEYKTAVLDTLQFSSTAYLEVLRAKALEAVQRSNLEVTRANLELARSRFKIGYSGRSDVLRWESQRARDKQNLLAAEADRRTTETELNRILHQPQTITIGTADTDVQNVLSVLKTPRFRRYIETPKEWETFQSFYVKEAHINAPEIVRYNNLIAAQERQVKASRRAFFLPDLRVAARGGKNINRSGKGSDLSGTGLDDDEWNVGLEATIPLSTGGARRAELSRSRHELFQIEYQRDSIVERVDSRMRSALHQIGASYQAIRLSREAADAAKENLDLVTDSYSKGAVGIIDLLDAQNAALSSELASAEAEYAFLIDFVEVLRASGNFDILLDPDGMENWFERLGAFY